MKKGVYIMERDCNGKRLHIGDLVVMWWGKSDQGDMFRMHRLSYNKEVKRVLLDKNCHNTWKGKEVEKISEHKYRKSGIKLGEMFYYVDGDMVKITEINNPDKSLYYGIDRAVLYGEIK